MSVTASFHPEPGDGASTYEIPVCTEALFGEVFRPIAVRLDLDLVTRWGSMTEISASIFSNFVDQLSKLRKSVIEDPDLTQEVKEHIESRLGRLRDEMSTFFETYHDGTVFIG
ncbi:hypothetical protein [Tahibacter caeni]|uniref:hypothetical protein n=1 Tax=Tahibacter caeni TaxID=1453545 RepID=UPI002148310E|nr:hypothetical protein [Tahibacter caeni]